MRAIDTAAIQTLGIPRLLLMEHAGLAVARTAHTLSPSLTQPIIMCCGTGLNGGDGLAAARHLQLQGHALRIVLAGRRDRLREEPAIYATILERLGVVLEEYADVSVQPMALEPAMRTSGLIIDALLGIGTQEQVREPIASLITCMNRTETQILAVDITSGLDGDTGQVLGTAVEATVTVTFGAPKQGCLRNAGPAHVGQLLVDPITIPRTLLTP